MSLILDPPACVWGIFVTFPNCLFDIIDLVLRIVGGLIYDFHQVFLPYCLLFGLLKFKVLLILKLKLISCLCISIFEIFMLINITNDIIFLRLIGARIDLQSGSLGRHLPFLLTLLNLIKQKFISVLQWLYLLNSPYVLFLAVVLFVISNISLNPFSFSLS